MHIHIDFETYSDLSVKDVGAYRYAEDPSTSVLVCGYAFDDEPVQQWLPWNTPAIPERLGRAVQRAGVLLCAHNAQFERAVWELVLRKHHGAPPTRREQWRCTAVLAAQAGLPRNLEGACAAISLPQQKNPDGKKLIKMFCMPRKPTKADARTRVMPLDARPEFKQFLVYNRDDILAERGLFRRLPPLPPEEQNLFALDMRINERGLPVDIPMVRKAMPIAEALAAQAQADAVRITGGIKATQVQKLREWCLTQVPAHLEMPNLQAATLAPLLVHPDMPEHVRDLLDIRLEAGIVSTKKFYSMMRVCSPRDGRARGTILFYGAHTGRWSGKLIQPHNFKRGKLTPAQQLNVFDILEHGDADMLLRLWANPITTLSMCMRGFIKPQEGRVLRVVDYAAIELHVLAWLCNQTDLVDALRLGMDVYKLMASRLFHVHIDAVTGEQRRIAKNIVLGCGYQLGWRSFIDYCARAGVFVTEELAQEAVGLYRSSYKRIVSAWYDIERAAIAAVQHGKPVRWGRVVFEVQDIWLTILLPSGRRLYYLYPKLIAGMRFGKPSVQLTFRDEFKGTMIRVSTYGGRIIENVVQAIARDLMGNGMTQAEQHGYPIDGTVHDEIINEGERDQGSIAEMEHIVCKLPKWAEGCPLRAEGFETVRYRKG